MAMEILKITRFSLLLFLHWFPRIAALLYIGFIFLFSFDVFDEKADFLKTLAGFLIHNIPTIILIVILILSWKWSWIGGISFIGIGIFYIFWFSRGVKYPIIYLPLLITGILFLLDWLLRKNIKEAQSAYQGDTR